MRIRILFFILILILVGFAWSGFANEEFKNPSQLHPTPNTITMPFTTLSVSGTVYDDGNGLTDNQVGGTGLGNSASTTLYAILINGSNNVVSNTTVANNGTYTLTGADGGTNYTVRISTTAGTIGNAAPSAALPTNWVNVGENYGAGTGSDGSVNGSLPVTTVGSNLTNANFGIDNIPVADAKTYTNQDPLSWNNPSGNGTYPWKMSLGNASGTADGAYSTSSASNLPGKVSGSDSEDGLYGGSTGSSGSRTVVFTTLPNSANDVLAYFNGSNDILLIPSPTNTDPSWTYWNSTLSRYEIPSFNPSNLSLYVKKNGHSSISFNYAWIDAGAVEGPAATYSITGSGPLPITLISFEGNMVNNQVVLTWITGSELNTSHFEVNRSNDGIEFSNIGNVTAAGNS